MSLRIVSLAALCITAMSGCSAEEGSTPEEAQGSATLELSTVPTGAQCLQITGTGGAAFSASLPLTAGASSAALTLGRLPVGTATVNANVYDVACSALAGAVPSWIADAQTATFRPGVVAKLTLNLRANNPVSANVNFVGNIVSITAGYQATGLVMSDGSTRVAGNWNPLSYGRVFTNSNASTLTGIQELDAARTYNAHACARNSSNQVICWGLNTAGELGTGVALGATANTPVVIAGISNAERIAVGDHHTCALVNGGGVYCLGLNNAGQVGNGTTTNVATPAFAAVPAGVDRIAAGPASTCVNSYAGIYCWGLNSSGQLGDGTTVNRTSPTGNGLMGSVSIDVGGTHACAVRADGTVRCWGSNANGQLGDGTTTSSSVPVQVAGVTDAVQVVAGANHTCIRRQGGTVLCFGSGTYGQIGDGTALNRISPTQVPGLTGVTTLAGGQYHTCALLDNQTVQCWGMDYAWQCGDNEAGNNYKPIVATVQ